MDQRIIFETSPWFILLCLLGGLLYALLLYWRKNPWGRRPSIALGLIRFIVVSTAAFLLLGPLIRQISNRIIPPALVIAVDNSLSIPMAYSDEEMTALRERIGSLMENLEDAGYAVELRSLDAENQEGVGEIRFDQSGTDLNQVLRAIENDYEGGNLSGVVLVSDGIYNQGFSPAYSHFSFPVYPVGAGDTTEKKDAVLRALYYNKIVYQGNRFPLIAEFTHSGYANRQAVIDVLKGGQRIDTRTVNLGPESGVKQVEFELEATEEGLQRYQVRIRALPDEFSLENNTRDAYVEVIEGREKILMLASAPHPDIKAIRNAVERNENYEFHLAIPGINDYQPGQYDVLILHQVPDRNRSFERILDDLLEAGTPTFHILGSRSNLSRFNEINQSVSIRRIRNQTDQVFPAINPTFDLFTLEETTRDLVSELPPIAVPFGEYTTRGNIGIMIFQQVGKIVTDKPLFLINASQERKEAIFSGEGLWQWRLNEYRINQDFSGFDDLIVKTIQFLSVREDKRKFKVYPVNTENPENEPVVFETEIYNDIYERIYDYRIDLRITNEQDSTFEYSYVTSPASSSFSISGLSPGVYRYTASSLINGSLREVTGMFSVNSMQLETISLTANHNLLKDLARRTGGRFFGIDETGSLAEALEGEKQRPMIESSEKFLAIINLKWLFFIILLLLTMEWGVRKYLGGY